MMDREARGEWWARLPRGIRDEVDGHVLRDALIPAVKVLVDVGRVPDGVGVATAQAIVHERYAHFGDRIARTPESPLDVESLAARARGVAGRVVVIEAIWDGDTVDDWFVVLVAVADRPAEEVPLATVTRRAAVRHLGEAPARPADGRHPAAVVAARAGADLAARLGVPFHFASPDTPDDEAPRWTPH
ncbi:hypothetical protein ACFVU3_11085 [Streptomyces sp. NPDC058052]|uniref:hypothetical protein n=1 Tax=Streptomyces sp. NPDC058052 TaxID=3346316 RepID=UPI0036ED1E09